MGGLRIAAREEAWPVAGTFTIARGSRTEARVVVVEVTRDGLTGRGESTPYPRYGETVDHVIAAVRSLPPDTDRDRLQQRLKPGAARNAVDCALWDLEAKRSGRSVHELAGVAAPRAFPTFYTLSLDTPENMARQARAARAFDRLKIKLGGGLLDAERMRAVRAARPNARLIADANEAWQSSELQALLDTAAEARFEMVEQPLPANADSALASVTRRVPVCADESAHTRADLPALAGLYDAVNIKLDKAGGLTEALAIRQEARRLGFKVMVGCMLSTSLAIAPALLVADGADWVDLDAPALLARDREHGLSYQDGMVHPADPRLWG